MDRSQAIRRCGQLEVERGAAGVGWLPLEPVPGEWTVVRVRAEGLTTRRGGIRATVDARGVRPDPAADIPTQPNPYWGF